MKKGFLSTRSRRLTSVDLPFLIGVILLIIIGLATLYSASFAKALAEDRGSFAFILNQLKNTGIGLVVMVVASWFPYRAYKKMISLTLYGISLFLLIAVLFLSDASEKRWIELGSFQFQPSEIAKVAVILLLASYLSSLKPRTGKFWKDMLTHGLIPSLIFGLVTVLIGLEPHLSGVVLVGSIGIIMMITARVKIAEMIPIGVVGVVGVFYLLSKEDYMRDRLQYWLHPELDPIGEGYQALQSFYAIGSGGLTGLGYGEGRQKYLYLPEPQNDFIFSVFCEEMGWIGAIIVMALFFFVIWRGFQIAAHAPDTFSSLIVVGIISRLAVQTLFNIAVVSGVFPVTGISLPFFSYGGTAQIVLLGEMGIVLQISRYATLDKDRPVKQTEHGKNKEKRPRVSAGNEATV